MGIYLLQTDQATYRFQQGPGQYLPALLEPLVADHWPPETYRAQRVQGLGIVRFGRRAHLRKRHDIQRRPHAYLGGCIDTAGTINLQGHSRSF